MGLGMSLDKMDRLFKPFAQLEYTLSRKRDGAGLGLAICKELVELMGGEIWTESVEAKDLHSDSQSRLRSSRKSNWI